MTDFETVRIVRPYTSEERAATIPKEQENPRQRLARIVVTHQIDAERYREAAKEHPEMSAHFERLIDVGERAVNGWRSFIFEAWIENNPYIPPGTEADADHTAWKQGRGPHLASYINGSAPRTSTRREPIDTVE